MAAVLAECYRTSGTPLRSHALISGCLRIRNPKTCGLLSLYQKKREQSWVLSTLRQARAAIQLNKHGDEVSTLVHPKPHSIHNHASQCGKPKNRPNPSFPEMGGIDSSIDHPPSGGFNVNLPR